ncbi:hypothetical protein AOLI_G00039920 [Acnodon oligacanthus]
MSVTANTPRSHGPSPSASERARERERGFAREEDSGRVWSLMQKPQPCAPCAGSLSQTHAGSRSLKSTPRARPTGLSHTQEQDTVRRNRGWVDSAVVNPGPASSKQ